MIEIKVPPTPADAPEHLFLGSVIDFVNTEPRLAKPLSKVALGIRLIDAAESAKASGFLQLSDDDHRALCELLETSEASFIRLFAVDRETKEEKQIDVNPLLERLYVSAILKAKPAPVAEAAE
jgi:hypothetical protein